VGLTRQWNWRAIVGGPSGTNVEAESKQKPNKSNIQIKNKIKNKIKGDGQECPSHISLATEDEFGVEEGAGDAGGDGD
jgi:hypothetical protein